MRNALRYLATEPLRLRPDPWSPSDYDPRRALSHLPPAKPPKILKLQRKFYKSKTYFGIFKVFKVLIWLLVLLYSNDTRSNSPLQTHF